MGAAGNVYPPHPAESYPPAPPRPPTHGNGYTGASMQDPDEEQVRRVWERKEELEVKI